MSLLKRIGAAAVGIGMLGMALGATLPAAAEGISTPVAQQTGSLSFGKKLEDVSYDSTAVLGNYSDSKVTSNKEAPKKEKSNPLTFFGYGSYDFGRAGYTPCLPKGVSPMPEYDSAYSFGLGLDYKIMDNIAVYVEGGTNSWKTLLAKKGEYSSGEWIFDETDYSSQFIGPFPMDTYYYMDTMDVKLGARLIAPIGKIQPWVGADYGIYSWDVMIGNKDEGKQFGEDSGVVTGLTYSAGVDFDFDGIMLRVFGEGASPVAYPKIKNLFHDGWIFNDSGTGEHVVGPYRAGVAIGTSF